MKKIAIIALASFICASCGSKGEKEDVPVYDLSAAINSPRIQDLKVEDIKFTTLDTVSNALFGYQAYIVDVIGDTLILRDSRDMAEDRLLLFTLPDGKLVGEINHKGQGPGEYRWLDNVYVDRGAKDVVLNSPDNVAYRYTLSDSLVSTYHHNIPTVKRLTKGSLDKGINFYEEDDNGFIIRQVNKDFVQTDSIRVEGYPLGYLSGEFINFGDEGAITMVDTLYLLKPGRLEKTAVLSRGGKTITPEIEKELSNMSDHEKRMEKQQEYISLSGNVIPEGDVVMINYYNGEAQYIDFYRRNDGKLLTHIPVLWSNRHEKAGMEVKYEDSLFYVRPQFARNGRWYAIIPDSDLAESDGDGNGAIISFTLSE